MPDPAGGLGFRNGGDGFDLGGVLGRGDDGEGLRGEVPAREPPREGLGLRGPVPAEVPGPFGGERYRLLYTLGATRPVHQTAAGGESAGMTAIDPEARSPRRGPAPVQGMGMLIGLLFLVLGACELMPGVTVGDGPTRALFGVFAVSAVWTVVHLVTGAAAVFCSRSPGLASRFLLAGGAGYAVLGIAGLLPLPRAVAGALPMNTAAVILALALGTAMLILGAGWFRRRPGRRR